MGDFLKHGTLGCLPYINGDDMLTRAITLLQGIKGAEIQCMCIHTQVCLQIHRNMHTHTHTHTQPHTHTHTHTHNHTHRHTDKAHFFIHRWCHIRPRCAFGPLRVLKYVRLGATMKGQRECEDHCWRCSRRSSKSFVQ